MRVGYLQYLTLYNVDNFIRIFLLFEVISMGYSAAYIKKRTLELYDSLPHDLEERKKCKKVRDEVIELNYKFFGYVASTTYVDNTTYEDKFQTALLAFLGMWWKYKWTPKYRDDLSFAVFFKPRIAEEIKRALSPVSYTTRRTLCMKVAKQLGKKWSDVCYDDLAKVNLPPQEITALKAVLGASYPADLAEFELFLEAPRHNRGIEHYHTYKYDSIEDLLIQEMIETETKLSDKHLADMANLYSIDYSVLKAAMPVALERLYKKLTDNLD